MKDDELGNTSEGDFWEDFGGWIVGIGLLAVVVIGGAIGGANWLDAHFGWHLSSWLHSLIGK